MLLSNEQLKRFREIWAARFGREISDEDAYEQAAKLMRLMSIVYRPMTEEEFEAIQKRREETK